MNDLLTNLYAEGIGVVVAVLIAYALDKWGEYRNFGRARANLHKWSSAQRANMWRAINRNAQSEREAWQKHLYVSREIMLSRSSMFHSIDSLRVNHGDFIDEAIQAELAQERMFWQQAGALFSLNSMTFVEMKRRNATIDEHLRAHIEWTSELIARDAELEELTRRVAGKRRVFREERKLEETPDANLLQQLLAETIPYALDRRRLAKGDPDWQHLEEV